MFNLNRQYMNCYTYFPKVIFDIFLHLYIYTYVYIFVYFLQFFFFNYYYIRGNGLKKKKRFSLTFYDRENLKLSITENYLLSHLHKQYL